MFSLFRFIIKYNALFNVSFAGMKLALMEIKIAIMELIRNFELVPSYNTRYDKKIDSDSFLLRVHGDIHLHIKPVA